MSWRVLGALAVVLVYVHVFAEWLFHLTKPSFLSVLGRLECLYALLLAPLPLAALSAGAVGAARVAALAAPPRAALAAARAVPAFVATSCGLVLADNFTLTTLGFGIGSASGPGRWVYALAAAALAGRLYGVVRRLEAAASSRAGARRLSTAAVALVALSAAGAAGAGVSSPAGSPRRGPAWASGAPRRPNILLIGSDGLAAEHMSAYGYRRDTTPFLRSFMDRMLVAENHFANAGSSGASIASLLTGKLPTETGLVYPPDILRGKDAYEHLPAILRKAGYRSVQISMRHYADAYDLNLRDSFDTANFRRAGGRHLVLFGRDLGAGFASEAYFLGLLWDRVESRWLHLLGVRDMVDAFKEATAAAKTAPADAERIEELLRFLDRAPEPFFAHLHLTGTHGGTFDPPRRVFSGGKDQPESWMADFYDDAVLGFDAYVERIVGRLSDTGALGRTVVVVHSDHGMRWSTSARVPFMIHFPVGSAATRGRLKANTQNLDLAPTLLDYLGIAVPRWMKGRSLIPGEPERLRPIISTHSRQGAVRRDGWFEMPPSSGSFANLGAVTVVVCHRSHTLALALNAMWAAAVEGHTAPCGDDEVPTADATRSLILQHLRGTGYDVSSLEEAGAD